MKKTFAFAALLLGLTSAAFSSDMGNIAWTGSNVERLNELTKAEVVSFLNESGGIAGSPVAITDSEIKQFQWVDLAGDGKLELAMIVSAGPCCSALDIYWQNAPGKIKGQAFVNAGDLKKTIKDLNGDGSKELIIYSYLDSDSDRGAGDPAPMWPEVYRLQNGKYVESSRDFPDFYDKKVLPELTDQIGKLQQKWPPSSRGEPSIAVLTMERDKILRMLGRDPTAGLAQAREWAGREDPRMIENAAVVFRDIGGHDDEARAATAAWKRAMAQQRATKS